MPVYLPVCWACVRVCVLISATLAGSGKFFSPGSLLFFLCFPLEVAARMRKVWRGDLGNPIAGREAAGGEKQGGGRGTGKREERQGSWERDGEAGRGMGRGENDEEAVERETAGGGGTEKRGVRQGSGEGDGKAVEGRGWREVAGEAAAGCSGDYPGNNQVAAFRTRTFLGE